MSVHRGCTHLLTVMPLNLSGPEQREVRCSSVVLVLTAQHHKHHSASGIHQEAKFQMFLPARDGVDYRVQLATTRPATR